MMTSKTIRSVPIGALRTDSPDIIVFDHVYAIPVWRDDKIAWYDVYSKHNGLYHQKITSLVDIEDIK